MPNSIRILQLRSYMSSNLSAIVYTSDAFTMQIWWFGNSQR